MPDSDPEIDRLRAELAEWRTKALDVERHPVVAALRAELEAAKKEWDRLRGYHEAGCPAIADDESDAVLADYQQCTCITTHGAELEQQAVESRRAETKAIEDRNSFVAEINTMRSQLAASRQSEERLRTLIENAEKVIRHINADDPVDSRLMTLQSTLSAALAAPAPDKEKP